ncbi:hypothetical protein D3C72_2468700 [compost metagenome]
MMLAEFFSSPKTMRCIDASGVPSPSFSSTARPFWSITRYPDPMFARASPSGCAKNGLNSP